ncbi:MAG: hypothetical protein ACE147_22180 [Candidatus Methylomirabilales bacterium]
MMDLERERIELAAWLEELRGRDLTDPEVEAAAHRLADAGGVALDLVLAQLASPAEDPALLAVASQALRVWHPPYPVESLLELLGKREVGALAKALILRVLEGYGMDTRDVLGVGVDLEGYQWPQPPGRG